MDRREDCKPVPAEIGKFFKKLQLLPDYALQASLWESLIQYHIDPQHPYRRDLNVKVDESLVNTEVHNFLRKHGSTYFSVEQSRPGAPTYGDHLTTEE